MFVTIVPTILCIIGRVFKIMQLHVLRNGSTLLIGLSDENRSLCDGQQRYIVQYKIHTNNK